MVAAAVALRAERLHNQQLATPQQSPADIVTAFGAIQAQEYAHAKWALGLRAPGTTDASIEQLVSAGTILRTHPMRMTHHFVAPADIRWLLALLGPRMVQRAQPRWRELGLDDKTFGKSQAVLARALANGNHLTRYELVPIFERARISPEGQRMPHLLGRAEIDGLICSGARKGKHITFALLDERVPATRPLTREASLAELARRYFTTRGPATVQDFMWWSGLAAADAKAAVALADRAIARETIASVTYYRGTAATRTARTRMPAHAYLLGAYDEYAVAYKDRSAIGRAPAHATSFAEATLLGPIIVVRGEVVGTWRRTITPKRVDIALAYWRKPSPRDARLVERAADRYAAFLGLPR
jgi:hypothetical protein